MLGAFAPKEFKIGISLFIIFSNSNNHSNSLILLKLSDKFDNLTILKPYLLT